MQKVQGCILQLVMFIFSKQELRNVKRLLKYQLPFIMNLYMLFNVIWNHKYCVSRAKLFTSDDIELNPGPAVTQGNNPNIVVELLQFQLAQCNMAWEYYMLVVQVIVSLERCPISCMANLAITGMFVVLVFNIWEIIQKDSLKVVQTIYGWGIKLVCHSRVHGLMHYCYTSSCWCMKLENSHYRI